MIHSIITLHRFYERQVRVSAATAEVGEDGFDDFGRRIGVFPKIHSQVVETLSALQFFFTSFRNRICLVVDFSLSIIEFSLTFPYSTLNCKIFILRSCVFMTLSCVSGKGMRDTRAKEAAALARLNQNYGFLLGGSAQGMLIALSLLPVGVNVPD